MAQTFHDTEAPAVQFPGIDIELSKVLHASEAVTVPGPIPPSGSGVAVTRFTDIWDKGKAAVIWSETAVKSPEGTLLWMQKRSIFARVEGGLRRRPWAFDVVRTSRAGTRLRTGHSRVAPTGPAVPHVRRPQSVALQSPIRRRSRLSQADPARPVHLRHDRQGHDGPPARRRHVAVGSHGARFAGVVFPGETLKVSVWKDGDGFQAVVTAPGRDAAVALAGVELIPA